MIENIDRKNVYEGNGLNDLWPFTFAISTTDGSDIAVYITDDTGKTSERLTSGYSVDVLNKRIKYPDPAGTILPSGWKITLARETPPTQTTSLTTQNFDPKSVEVSLDKLTMLVQEIREIVSRALVADITVPAGTKYSLPAPAPGKAWGWNEDGTGVVNYDNPAVAAAQAQAAADAAAAIKDQTADFAAQAANSALQAGTVVDYEGEEPPVVTKPLLKWHKPSVHTIYLRNLADDGWIEFMDSETGAVKKAIAENANYKIIANGRISQFDESPYTITLGDIMVPDGQVLIVKVIIPKGFTPPYGNRDKNIAKLAYRTDNWWWTPQVLIYGTFKGTGVWYRPPGSYTNLQVDISHSIIGTFTYTDDTTDSIETKYEVYYEIALVPYFET